VRSPVVSCLSALSGTCSLVKRVLGFRGCGAAPGRARKEDEGAREKFISS
jgi:hypothetical protein